MTSFAQSARSVQFDALFRPRSVGVVGASATGQGFGNSLISNLISGGYTGTVHPIHRSASTINGLSAVSTFAELDGGLDCAVIALPAGHVNAALRDAAEAGARAAVVLSSGFAEAGDDGLQMAQDMRRITSETGIAVVGPNCLGVTNFVDRCVLTFLRGVGEMSSTMAARSGLAVISQSGALGSNLLQAYRYGAQFSYFVATGNSAVLDVGDFVGALAVDERVTGICLLYEGLREETELLSALASASEHDVPVVAVKAGRSAAGRRAASSHTASAVGDDTAAIAALRAHDVMVVDGPEQLVAAANFLARNRNKVKRPGGVGIVSGSGGIGVLLADSADRFAVPLAEFTPQTVDRLQAVLPSYSVVENPIDLTAGSIGGGGVRDALTALAEDDNTAVTVIALSTTIHDEVGAERMSTVTDVAAQSSAPLVAVLLAEGRSGPSLDALEKSQDLSVFRSTDLCLRTIAHWLAPKPGADEQPSSAESVDWAAIAARLDAAQRSETGLLDEPSSSAILAGLGVRGPQQAVFSTPAEVAAAHWGRYPAVAKVVSNDLAHKARYGGVAVGLLDQVSLVAACEKIEANISGLAFRPTISGYLVQEMALGSQEVLLGAIRDPLYGPVVVVGQGGGGAGGRSGAEALAAPFSAGRALAMVSAAPATATLTEQVRNMIATLVSNLGELMLRFPTISEVEVNPLLVTHDDRRIVGVDAVVRVTA